MFVTTYLTMDSVGTLMYIRHASCSCGVHHYHHYHPHHHCLSSLNSTLFCALFISLCDFPSLLQDHRSPFLSTSPLDLALCSGTVVRSLAQSIGVATCFIINLLLITLPQILLLAAYQNYTRMCHAS